MLKKFVHASGAMRPRRHPLELLAEFGAVGLSMLAFDEADQVGAVAFTL